MSLNGTTPTAQVDTVTDLLAMPIPTVATKLTALVTGRLTENDGGGGVFYYDPASAVAADGGTIFAPNAGAGRWLREYNPNIVELAWFAPTTNDTGDNVPIIELAISLLNTNGGGTLIFGDGTFRVKGDNAGGGTPYWIGVEIQYGNIIFKGAGRNKTFIKAAPNDSGGVDCFRINSPLANLTFQDMAIQCNGTVIAANFNGGHGFRCVGAIDDITFRDCDFIDSPNGHFIIDNSGATQSNRITFENCRFRATSIYSALGINIKSVDGLRVIGCTFDRCARGVSLEGNSNSVATDITIVYNTFSNSKAADVSPNSNTMCAVLLNPDGAGITRDVLIGWNEFLNNDKSGSTGSGAEIKVASTGGARMSNINIIGNRSRGLTGGGSNAIALLVESVDNGIAADNVFMNPLTAGQTGLRALDCKNCIFRNNVFFGANWASPYQESNVSAGVQNNLWTGNYGQITFDAPTTTDPIYISSRTDVLNFYHSLQINHIVDNVTAMQMGSTAITAALALSCSSSLTVVSTTELRHRLTLLTRATQTLAAATVVNTSAGTTIPVIGSGGAVLSTSAFATGQDGQIIILFGTHDTNTVTFQDNDTLPGTLLRLGATTRTLGNGDSLMIQYRTLTGTWDELLFSAV